MDIQTALRWRYATNKFDTTKKVSAEELTKILEAGNLMPSAYGLQPYKFVVVTDADVKEKLVESAYGQRHVADNSHLIVLAARTDIDEAFVASYTALIEKTRGLEPGSADGYKKVMVGDIVGRSEAERTLWAKRQAFLPLGGMMAAASLMNIDNHAMEGFNPVQFDEILGLKEHNLTAGVILALGYRAEDDAWQQYAKVRLPMDEIVVKK